MSEQGSVNRNSLSRRDFLKLIGAAGTAIAFAPFVPWGNYMPNPQNDNLQRAKVILPDGIAHHNWQVLRLRLVASLLHSICDLRGAHRSDLATKNPEDVVPE